MIMEITTETGSTYHIDTSLQTWARVVPPGTTGVFPLQRKRFAGFMPGSHGSPVRRLKAVFIDHKDPREV